MSLLGVLVSEDTVSIYTQGHQIKIVQMNFQMGPIASLNNIDRVYFWTLVFVNEPHLIQVK